VQATRTEATIASLKIGLKFLPRKIYKILRSF